MKMIITPYLYLLLAFNRKNFHLFDWDMQLIDQIKTFMHLYAAQEARKMVFCGWMVIGPIFKKIVSLDRKDKVNTGVLEFQ